MTEFLTTAEAAAVLRVTPQTLRTKRLPKDVRFKPPGSRRWLYHRAALLAWASGHTYPGGPVAQERPTVARTVAHRHPLYAT